VQRTLAIKEQVKCFYKPRETQELRVCEAVLGLPDVRAKSSQHLGSDNMAEPTACETRWAKIIASFEGKHTELLQAHPDCSEDLALLGTGIHSIGQLTHISPPANGNSVLWKDLVARAEAERVVLCKHLDGKALFTAMLRLYAALHKELRDSTLPAQQSSSEEFREQRRRKRNPSDEPAKKSKTSTPTPGTKDSKPRPQGEVATKNFFAPLRTAEMDVESTPVEGAKTSQPEKHQPAKQVGRHP
jgi:hypothetical protein